MQLEMLVVTWFVVTGSVCWAAVPGLGGFLGRG